MTELIHLDGDSLIAFEFWSGVMLIAVYIIRRAIGMVFDHFKDPTKVVIVPCPDDRVPDPPTDDEPRHSWPNMAPLMEEVPSQDVEPAQESFRGQVPVESLAETSNPRHALTEEMPAVAEDEEHSVRPVVEDVVFHA